jgi:hypothetical protein
MNTIPSSNDSRQVLPQTAPVGAPSGAPQRAVHFVSHLNQVDPGLTGTPASEGAPAVATPVVTATAPLLSTPSTPATTQVESKRRPETSGAHETKQEYAHVDPGSSEGAPGGDDDDDEFTALAQLIGKTDHSLDSVLGKIQNYVRGNNLTDDASVFIKDLLAGLRTMKTHKNDLVGISSTLRSKMGGLREDAEEMHRQRQVNFQSQLEDFSRILSLFTPGKEQALHSLHSYIRNNPQTTVLEMMDSAAPLLSKASMECSILEQSLSTLGNPHQPPVSAPALPPTPTQYHSPHSQYLQTQTRAPGGTGTGHGEWKDQLQYATVPTTATTTTDTQPPNELTFHTKPGLAATHSEGTVSKAMLLQAMADIKSVPNHSHHTKRRRTSMRSFLSQQAPPDQPVCYNNNLINPLPPNRAPVSMSVPMQQDTVVHPATTRQYAMSGRGTGGCGDEGGPDGGIHELNRQWIQQQRRTRMQTTTQNPMWQEMQSFLTKSAAPGHYQSSGMDQQPERRLNTCMTQPKPRSKSLYPHKKRSFREVEQTSVQDSGPTRQGFDHMLQMQQ